MSGFDWTVDRPGAAEFGPSEWRRACRSSPCPICRKPDWCCYTADGKLAVCFRVVSTKITRSGGYLHKVGDDLREVISSHARRQPALKPPTIDAPRVYQDMLENPADHRVWNLARELGLSFDALRAYGCVWSLTDRAWAWPMYGADRAVCGLRLRFAWGKKLSVSGSRAGIFSRDGWDASEFLLITEGPTDAGAAFDLGFAALGRPSCAGQEDILCEWLRDYQGIPIIVPDSDEPGLNGAFKLRESLRISGVYALILTPPAKDLRAWKLSGATNQDVSEWIARGRRLS